MTTAVTEAEGPERIISFTFSADDQAVLQPRTAGRAFYQIGVRRRNAADDGAATLGGGALKIQTAGVAAPSGSNDSHWLDTTDDTLAALEIGKSYKVELSGPLRIVLTGSTSPDIVVEVR